AAAAGGCKPVRVGEASATLIKYLRHILGNPFRPAPLAPAWLTPAVLDLAQAAYDNRLLPSGLLDNGCLAVLADALGAKARTETAPCRDAGRDYGQAGWGRLLWRWKEARGRRWGGRGERRGTYDGNGMAGVRRSFPDAELPPGERPGQRPQAPAGLLCL